MNTSTLRTLLINIREGKTDVETAIKRLRHLPFENIAYAHIDHHRQLRHGMPEVIYCEGKTLDQVIGIAKRMLKAGSDVLATRAPEAVYRALKKLDRRAVYHKASHAIVIQHKEKKLTKGIVLVLTAGTSDIPVADEAAVTAEMLGSSVRTVYDVGVAGIHRVLSKRDVLDEARVIIVVAGFQGLAPLLTMLNSCASGIAVMNIDNGFGAGVLAHRINALGER